MWGFIDSTLFLLFKFLCIFTLLSSTAQKQFKLVQISGNLHILHFGIQGIGNMLLNLYLRGYLVLYNNNMNPKNQSFHV